MSLPLWEECAWYVDYGDEVEAETEENHEEQQITTEQVAESIEDEYIPINIVDDHEIVSIGIATPGVGEGLHDPICPGTNAIVGEDVGEESTEEQHTEADPVIGGADGTEANNTHTSDVEDVQNDVPPKEATAEKGVVEEEHSTEISIEIVESDEDSEPPKPTYKFPISRSINRRMYLYLGEIYKLPCDAIVVGQVESLTDKNDGNDVIFTLAGIELEPELVSMAPCTTGDSVVTRGWQMPCEWIIHAVGPKYDERYLNASDHALFSAYKSALLLATEKEVQSLVIGTVYKQSKKYPRFEAAHVALRTVRKYLEHSVGDSLDRVMFCVNTQEDFEIYSALMHAYFPRSEEELQDQLNLLPIELGDEWGEIIIADRVVKVSSGPQPLPAESLQQYKGSQEEKDTTNTPPGPVKLGIRDVKPVGVMPRSMTQCDSDPDYARRKKVAEEFANMSKEERLRLRFQAMAKGIEEEEDLDELDSLQLIHFLGKDFKDRTMVYLSGPNLMLAESMDPNRVLLYLIRRMEPLRCVPFVLVYGCHTLGESFYPDTAFMQGIFDLFSYRYRENLMKFYILHASYTFRMYFWMILPLETTTFWSTYINLTNLRSFRHYVDITTLDIPEYLLRYDRDNYTYT